MLDNKLTIKINKPIAEVFGFTITPPNSTRWIPSIISEETNEWPIKSGTVYKLQNKNGEYFEIIVATVEENEMVEWVAKDRRYHCRYIYKSLGKNITELEYYEWVDRGELNEPFTIEILEKLKEILEK